MLPVRYQVLVLSEDVGGVDQSLRVKEGRLQHEVHELPEGRVSLDRLRFGDQWFDDDPVLGKNQLRAFAIVAQADAAQPSLGNRDRSGASGAIEADDLSLFSLHAGEHTTNVATK